MFTVPISIYRTLKEELSQSTALIFPLTDLLEPLLLRKVEMKPKQSKQLLRRRHLKKLLMWSMQSEYASFLLLRLMT
jgi:hypothetical protein